MHISKRKQYKDAVVAHSQLGFTWKSLFLSVAESLLDTGPCTQTPVSEGLPTNVASLDKGTPGRWAALQVHHGAEGTLAPTESPGKAIRKRGLVET